MHDRYAHIPVVINNRNRFTTLKKMIDCLLHLNEVEPIIIIDNESTYPPLLRWYRDIDFDYKYKSVLLLREKNHGHLALWSMRLDKKLPEYFIYTDSDLVLSEDFPIDWKEIMINTMLEHDEKKVALGIHIDDLPDHYKYKHQVRRNEGRWWLDKVDEHLYRADTDTTFCVMENFGDNCYKSLRLTRPDLMCRHLPWYYDLDNLDEEEQYYLDNLGSRVTTQYSIQHKEKERFNDV
jgi:hypothetical protein